MAVLSNRTCFLMVISVTTIASPIALGQGSIDIIAIEGQTAPDGNGMFSEFGQLQLNEKGEIAFSATLTGADSPVTERGIFLGAVDSLTQVVRSGQASPDGNGRFFAFSTRPPPLNDAGHIVFVASLAGTLGGYKDSTGVFLAADGTLTQLAREGEAVPGINGVFEGFTRSLPSINNADQVAFIADIDAPYPEPRLAVLLSTPDSLEVAVASLAPVPLGDGVLSTFSEVKINDLGEIAFRARLVDGDYGLYHYADEQLNQVARDGQPAPDGDGVIELRPNDGYLFDNHGDFTVFAELLDTLDGVDDQAIFRTSNGSLMPIVRTGEPAADADRWFYFLRQVTHNDLGQVAFSSVFGNLTGGASFVEAILVADEQGISEVITDDDTLGPDQIKDFKYFLSTNDDGHLAFLVTFVFSGPGFEPGHPDHALMLKSQHGLTHIARPGDPLADSTIGRLVRIGTSPRDEIGQRAALNARGQVAFAFLLEDGRQGIALFTPVPEPSASALLLGAVISLAVGSRRRAAPTVLPQESQRDDAPDMGISPH